LKENESRPKTQIEFDLNYARETNLYMINKVKGKIKAMYEREDKAIQREPLQPTVNGKLIECNYRFEIKMNYGCCDNWRRTPRVFLAMPIYSDDIKIEATPAPKPQNW